MTNYHLFYYFYLLFLKYQFMRGDLSHPLTLTPPLRKGYCTPATTNQQSLAAITGCHTSNNITTNTYPT